MKRSIAILAGTAAAAAAGYAILARPNYLRWGTTWRERSRIWAGDELMPAPSIQSTRVVTIHAPAKRVWPWVAQIGQDRGGFYSYTSLENLVGAGMQNADEIHPEWQHRDVGEKVWLGEPSKFEGQAHMIVARWIPEKCMALVAPPDWEQLQAGCPATRSVWSFILEPLGTKSCRLIVRTLGGFGPGIAEKAAHYLFWEPAHFVMERGMMLGIKQRAEALERESLPVRILQTAAGLAQVVRKIG